MARATYRFREHVMTPDPVSEPVLHMWECKAPGCGATSEASEDPSTCSEWSAEHFKANPEHTGFREIITRAYRYQPGDWK